MAEIINLANERAFRAWDAAISVFVARPGREANRFPLPACIYCAGIGRRETWQGSGQTETCICVDPGR